MLQELLLFSHFTHFAVPHLPWSCPHCVCASLGHLILIPSLSLLDIHQPFFPSRLPGRLMYYPVLPVHWPQPVPGFACLPLACLVCPRWLITCCRTLVWTVKRLIVSNCSAPETCLYFHICDQNCHISRWRPNSKWTLKLLRVCSMYKHATVCKQVHNI